VTGPEHYQAAERRLYKAENQGARGGTETAEPCAAIAHVHVTLALAAATALGRANHVQSSDPDREAWRKAAGTDES